MSELINNNQYVYPLSFAEASEEPLTRGRVIAGGEKYERKLKETSAYLRSQDGAKPGAVWRTALFTFSLFDMFFSNFP